MVVEQKELSAIDSELFTVYLVDLVNEMKSFFCCGR